MRLPIALSLAIALATLCCSVSARAQTRPIKFAAPHHGVSGEEVLFFGLGSRGELRPAELDILGKLLRCRHTGRQQPIHPRLAQTLVNIAGHFHQPVRVMSGYQAISTNNHPHSYHMRGMAADIAIPGVPLSELRDYAVQRRIGGIGFYPNSNFVHIDVRPRRFWWVDYSLPNHPEELIPDPNGTAPNRPAKIAVSSQLSALR